MSSFKKPRDIIDRVHATLGLISLDPASCPQANDTVQAEGYYTEADDGLAMHWPVVHSVFLNPPGGKRANRSMAQLFWDKLIQSREQFGHAIFMGFSLEQMQTTQRSALSILDFPFCVPRRRVKFVSPAGVFSAPSHSNVIVYVPSRIDCTDVFLQQFATIGKCVRP
jgi:hypothetical protein